VLFSEIVLDEVRVALSAPEVEAEIVHHLFEGLGALSSDGIGFDIVVEELIGVQLGAIGRQEKEANLSLVLLEPLSYWLAATHRVTVHNQKHLLGSSANQTTQKIKHHRSANVRFINMS